LFIDFYFVFLHRMSFYLKIECYPGSLPGVFLSLSIISSIVFPAGIDVDTSTDV
jgi:hypothetical protein